MPYLESPPESPTQPSGAPPHFACERRRNGATVWIRARGELDLASAPQFEQVVHEALNSALLVVIDLRELSFMDSTAIHAIIEADIRARRSERRLAFVRGSAQIDRLFKLVGLSDRLEILDPEAGFDRVLTAPVASES